MRYFNMLKNFPEGKKIVTFTQEFNTLRSLVYPVWRGEVCIPEAIWVPEAKHHFQRCPLILSSERKIQKLPPYFDL